MNNKESNIAHENILGPLLDALGWRGPDYIIQDSIPLKDNKLTTQDIINTLANLKYTPTIRKNTFLDKSYPFPYLAVDKSDTVKVIVKKLDGDNYFYFDNISKKYQQGLLPDKFKRIIHFKFKDELVDSVFKIKVNWFIKTVKRFSDLLIKTFTLSFFISLFTLASPLIIMLIYGQLAIVNIEINLVLLFSGIALILTLEIILTMYRDLIFGYLSSRFGYIINSEFMRRTIYLPLEQTDSLSKAEHLSRTKNFQNISFLFHRRIISTIFDLPFTGMMLLAIFILAGEVVYIPIASIIAFVIFSFHYNPLVSKLSQHAGQMAQEKKSFLIDSISNLENLTTPEIKRRWTKKYKEMHLLSISNNKSLAKVSNSIDVLSTAIISITVYLTIWVCVKQVIDGQLDPAGLMAVILLIWKTLSPIKSIYSLTAQFHQFKGNIKSIDQFMNINTEEVPEDFFKQEKMIKGSIQFYQVFIRFTKDSFPSLINVDLNIAPLQTTLISGKNGSGKSTILKLILALYKPQMGQVIIDGINVQQLNPLKVRSEIFYCPNDKPFFKDTILNNFKLKNRNIKEEEILEMLDKTGAIHEFNNLPDGLHTTIDENVPTLFPKSFIKKLAISRAFLSDTRVILFDDLSLELNKAEMIIILKLFEQYRYKKTIVIADQEPSLLFSCDYMIVLEKGKTIFKGTAKEARERF
jgi:ATP-binding cassette subfamily C protein LapB